ncbi:cathepsin B [Paragonimus westermani]|uniref:Cathepsin B n=1 Tax=Paragonimus westermani TaxID=34504 RepID=A0A5J4N7W1_9TREM|nr:cathepsin B [Paragonimus westermani]
MKWTLLLLTATVLVTASTAEVSSRAKNLRAFTDDLINYVNEESGAHWKAAPSRRFRNVEEAKRYLGARREGQALRNARRMTISHEHDTHPLPESFDAREQWSNCTSIGEIRDQSGCGSCWAFGAVEAMSDRICIHSNDKVDVRLSARDLLSCCDYCGFGCEGGFPGAAWDYWEQSGIVTGDSMEQQTGCRPYPFPTCSHHGTGHRPPCPKKIYDTPECLEECQEKYPKTYTDDKYFGESLFRRIPATF